MIKVSTHVHANRNDDRELGLSVDWGSRVEIQDCLLTGGQGRDPGLSVDWVSRLWCYIELPQKDHPM